MPFRVGGSKVMPLRGCNRETNKLADGKNRLKKKNQRLRASEWLIWDCTGRHTGWDFEYRRLNLQITFGLSHSPRQISSQDIQKMVLSWSNMFFLWARVLGQDLLVYLGS